MQYYVVVAADEHNTHGFALNDVPADVEVYAADACDRVVPQLTGLAVTCSKYRLYSDWMLTPCHIPFPNGFGYLRSSPRILHTVCPPSRIKA